MILTKIEQDTNTVCALPSVLDELANIPANMQAHATAMQKLFKRYAEGGRQKLNKSIFHEADRENGIWEFTHGRVRVFCFMDGGSLIVLTTVAIKKTQKVDQSCVRDALNTRNQYMEAKRNNTLEIKELGEVHP